MSISRLRLANKEAAGLSLALISRPSARRRETGRSGDVLRPDGSRYGPSEGRGKVVCQGERKGVLKGGGSLDSGLVGRENQQDLGWFVKSETR